MFLDFCLKYLDFERFKEAAQLPGAINCNNFNSLTHPSFYSLFFFLFCSLVLILCPGGLTKFLIKFSNGKNGYSGVWFCWERRWLRLMREEKKNLEFHLNFPKLRPENMEEKPERLQQGRVKRELPSPLFQKAFWWQK